MRSHSSHSSRHAARVPVEVVDVLVLLGRVLGVLDRAVGPLQEPLGVLGQPRMVGRRVERDVQAHVHAVLVGGRAQRLEVVHRPELGVHGVVPALGGADRVRRAGIVGAGGERVVAALAVLAPDRVDRREVQDVEAEVGDRRDLLLDRLQAAPRAREQLVPGAEPGAHAVDVEREAGGQPRRAVALAGPRDRVEEVRRERRLGPGARLERVERALDRGAVLAGLGALGGVLEQHDALGELAREVVLAGGVLALQLVAPGAEQVAPRLDVPLPAARRLHGELAFPEDAVDVGVDRVHRHLEPAAGARRLVADDGAQHLVAVAEDVGRHPDRVADAALGRVASAVHRRCRVVDPDPRRRFGSLGGGHSQPGVSDIAL